MTGAELLLVQSIKDAVALLRWQCKKPLGAETWGEWVVTAMTIVDEVSTRGRTAVQGDL